MENEIATTDVSNTFVIDIPRKVSRPKIKTIFHPEPSYSDVDEGHFVCPALGNTVLRQTDWKPGIRNDIVRYSEEVDGQLLRSVKFEDDLDVSVKGTIQTLIKEFWDVFTPVGLRNPMLGYEFCIDTGRHTPYCCKKPAYGAHESKIIMSHVNKLLDMGWIKHCDTGGWCSPIVLAPKPHQEHVTDIDNFVWRMCVSYRGLNKITNPFEYPISRCDIVIEDLGDGNGIIYFICLDAAQGYHQIRVRKCDQDKLAFFAPDGKKYTYTVMPFGPRNAPTFYTLVTRMIQEEATNLFKQLCNGVVVDLDNEKSLQPEYIVSNLPRTDDYQQSCGGDYLPLLSVNTCDEEAGNTSPLFRSTPGTTNSDDGSLTVRQKMKNSSSYHLTGSRVIIDDIMLRSTSTSLLLLLLECFLRIYLKYRTTLNLKKCNFLKKRFEFVGHDILSIGNTTARSKYDLINDWELPESADGLHSFVSLCNFYTKFLPMFEMKVSPLRQLYTKYLHSKIPNEAWSEELISLFSSLKTDLTTEPVLARYDSNKPIFLKTDWSSLGMSFIMTQPGNDKASAKATRKLLDTGVCDFDSQPTAPRLRAISSGMRKCTEGESHYHSFVGEIAALRWAIAKNKLYLWGITFYVLCDMKTTYRILEYDGPIHSLRRWCQELQNYHFVVFHRPATMMVDVDALNRGPYHRISTMYYAMTAAIRSYDYTYNKKAYDATTYNAIIAKGKLNLKKVSSWNMTALYSLRAASLLTTISTKINDGSAVLSDKVASHLSLFVDQDASNTCSSLETNNATQAMPHRDLKLIAYSNAMTSPNTHRTPDVPIAQSNVAVQSSETVKRTQNRTSSTAHGVAPSLKYDWVTMKQSNHRAIDGIVAKGEVLASFLNAVNVTDSISKSIELPTAAAAIINASHTASTREVATGGTSHTVSPCIIANSSKRNTANSSRSNPANSSKPNTANSSKPNTANSSKPNTANSSKPNTASTRNIANSSTLNIDSTRNIALYTTPQCTSTLNCHSLSNTLSLRSQSNMQPNISHGILNADILATATPMVESLTPPTLTPIVETVRTNMCPLRDSFTSFDTSSPQRLLDSTVTPRSEVESMNVDVVGCNADCIVTPLEPLRNVDTGIISSNYIEVPSSAVVTSSINTKLTSSLSSLGPSIHTSYNVNTSASRDICVDQKLSTIQTTSNTPVTATLFTSDIVGASRAIIPTVSQYSVDAGVISRKHTNACYVMNASMPHITTACIPTYYSQTISIPHRRSLPSYALSNPIAAATTATPSLSRFLSEHIIRWVSYNPGVCTLGLHLTSAFKERLDLTIVEPNETCVALNEALLPDALVLQGDWVTLQYMFGLCELPRDGEANVLDLHHITLPIATTDILNGINLHFEETLTLPLPSTLPLTVRSFVDLITNLSETRKLQYFVAFWPLSHSGSIPLRSDNHVIQKRLIQWSIVCRIVYAPTFGDKVAATRYMVLGNHRTRSERPLQALTFPTHTSPNCSGFMESLSHFITDTTESIPFTGSIPPDHQHNPITPRFIVETAKATPNDSLPIADERYPAPEFEISPRAPFRILHRFRNHNNELRSRPITPTELFNIYLPLHNPPSLAANIIDHLPVEFYNILQTKVCPWHMTSFIVTQSRLHINTRYNECSKHQNIARCMINKPLPTTTDWTEAYASDKDTNYLIGRLRDNTTPLSEDEIRNVHAGYRHALREDRISFRKNRLLLFTTVGGSNRFLCLIIVPTSLRQLVFFAYHASGSGAHMKAFKTLLLVRLRFFWPCMRKMIMLWVKGCTGCIPAAARDRESSGLVHSWPVTTPFCIISVDIWKPGEVVNIDGYKALLNAMCDMTQFVVSTPVKCLVAAHIARAFMEGVLLKVGLCVVVVVDEGREFCSLFRDMCRLLNIKCHVVAKRNHKAVGVERYHRFLNHSQRICSEERGTPASFVECGLTTAYAWNASPIDGTDIVRSVPAIGRVLRFPLDIHESELPQPITDVTRSVTEYVRYLGRDVNYARELLSWLVADRREAHRERTNLKRKPIVYRVGDIVMGRVAVQSSREKGVIQKLVYQSRGPYVIERVTGYDTYYVRRYGKPQSALQKFMASDLYMLPPQILPCEHVDTPTLRYLNSDFAPLRHPFSKNFDIEGYNTSWFDDKPVSRPPDFLLDKSFLDTSAKKATPLSKAIFDSQLLQLSDDYCPATEKNLKNPTSYTKEIMDESENILTIEDGPIEKTTVSSTSNRSIEEIKISIDNSTDKLFFVRFIPSNTLRPKWFLVQVVSPDSDDDPLQNGIQFCTFLQKHPKDKDLADNKARWWPEWRELIWDDKNDYDFGDRILFGPLQKPDLNFFGKFGTEINFDDPETVLVGPFEFVPRTLSTSGNCFISDDHWKTLYDKCITYSLTPPTLSNSLRHLVAQASTYRCTLEDRNFSNDMVSNSSLSSLIYFFERKEGTLRSSKYSRKSDG